MKATDDVDPTLGHRGLDVPMRDATPEVLGLLWAPVYQYCLIKFGSQNSVISAEDVAQDTLLALYIAFNDRVYDNSQASVLRVAFAIADRKLNPAARSATYRTRPVAFLDEVRSVEPYENGPEHQAARSELASELQALMERLLPHHREVLLLRIAMGYSVQEIADMLGTTPGAVRATQYRALAHLRVSADRAVIAADWIVPATRAYADTDDSVASEESIQAANRPVGFRQLFADFVRETEASLDLDEGLQQVRRLNIFERLTNALTEGIDLDAGLAELRARAAASRRLEEGRSE